MWAKKSFASAALALVVGRSAVAAAQDASCGPQLSRATVVRCAIARSPDVRAEVLGVEAARGREAAAAVVLPSNPVLSATIGRPIGGTGTATAWSASLAQEIEIAGQRGARLDAARAEIRAQAGRVAVARRDAVFAALTAYFDAVAARDEAALATRLGAIAEGLAGHATSRAEQGLAAPVDADVAYAASVRLVQARAASNRKAALALATLATHLGVDPLRPGLSVEGGLTPLPVDGAMTAPVAERAVATRPELDVAAADASAHASRASVLRRSRVPNPTLSFFVETDTLNERTIGGGVSFPLLLPSPLGRSNAGEIAEETALAARSSAQAERLRRQIRLELATAAQTFASRRAELAAFDPARLARTERALVSIAEELAAGRLAVRDALVSEQALVELLQAHLEARRALCVASVELARALGRIERGVP